MSDPESTCWTMIQAAGRGEQAEIDAFIHRYGPVVRAYLKTRWMGRPAEEFVEDASQEVFLQCFREGGVLERATPETLRSFRAFLLGVTRNIALGFEARKFPRQEKQPDTGFDPVDPKAADERPSIAFERAWAESLVRDAAVRQAERAEILGKDARRRHALLELRFHEGLSIREIARRWNEQPRRVHKQYEKARAEFEDALKDVISFHCPGEPEAAARELARLMEAMR